MKRRAFAIVAALSLLTNLLPSKADAAAAWSVPLTIESFLPTVQHLTLIVSGNDNPVGCASGSWLRLHFGDPNYNLIASTLLTAFTQGKTVRLWEANCETDGTIHFIAARLDKS